jgi:AsmA protein
VQRNPDGSSNWTAFLERLTQTVRRGAAPLSFSEIRIQDGVATYRRTDSAHVETIGDIDLSLAWPSISRSFAATGQFDWRGERIDGSISVGDFLAALSGERSTLKVRLSGSPLKFAFDGGITNRTSLLLEGVLTADSPSLRNALRWGGLPPPGGGGFGRFALKGRASLVGSALALTAVNLELDGNAAEGVMTYTNATRPTVQATLAGEALDFTPYLAAFRVLTPGREWNRQLFEMGILSATDLDIRLSAAKLTIGSASLGRTALGGSVRSGSLALSVGEAQMCNGIGKGSLGIGNVDGTAEVKAQFQLVDIDLQGCARDFAGTQKLSGRGTLVVTVEAAGNNPFALASSLDGTASLTARDGAISGFNAEQLLRRLERRPLSGTSSLRNGQTPYSALTAALKFSDGTATVDDLSLDGPAAKIRLSGTASVPQREYDLKGTASLSTGARFELPFLIQGPWDDPLIFPDPEALIRRSPASAPLLDAVKDRKAREAVRSVLERITGRPQGSEPTPGAAPPAAALPPAPAPAPTQAPAAVPDSAAEPKAE